MKAEHALSQLCAAFDVKRSGYHAWVKAGASIGSVYLAGISDSCDNSEGVVTV